MAYGHMTEIESRFVRDGEKFELVVEQDEIMGPPWDAHDGHGPVRICRTVGKRPGERALHGEAGRCVLYDWQEATKIAKRDKWGIDEDLLTQIIREKGRRLTRKEITGYTVAYDYLRMKDWCEGNWHWVSLCVIHLRSREERYIGGVESDDTKGMLMFRDELAEDILIKVQSRFVREIRKQGSRSNSTRERS